MTLFSRVNRLTLFKKKSPDQVRFDRLAKLCESPIERLFWATGYRKLSRRGHFTPQVKIDRYRVDFALTNIPGAPRLKVVIELYGYEHHHTQEQVLYDEERRQQIEGSGWKFMVFWGIQINGNCRSCVSKVEGCLMTSKRKNGILYGNLLL